LVGGKEQVLRTILFPFLRMKSLHFKSKSLGFNHSLEGQNNVALGEIFQPKEVISKEDLWKNQKCLTFWKVTFFSTKCHLKNQKQQKGHINIHS